MGLDPVDALGRLRGRSPIARLTVPFAMNVWLVTGYPQARAVLGATAGFSTDSTRLTKIMRATIEHPGGLAFTDPPLHTRLRRLLARSSPSGD
ncbi:hypothetical protein [Nocardia pseudovaccinii]|uniref:hypothetical protein n=1 Tax=Nocardia pseudovaccinii TaxID=189540 RepID=UPI001C3FAFDE|nr:hypothetical protein [Nocardia pseudovaccinii]